MVRGQVRAGGPCGKVLGSGQVPEVSLAAAKSPADLRQVLVASGSHRACPGPRVGRASAIRTRSAKGTECQERVAGTKPLCTGGARGGRSPNGWRRQQGQRTSSTGRPGWGLVLAGPLLSCVALGMSVNLSGPHWPQVSVGWGTGSRASMLNATHRQDTTSSWGGWIHAPVCQRL